ncbi:Hsp20/alpha crystallin family protein [Maribacter sp. 2307ULW6-5]|uniref:Hsp20/alpha crystallin family protein n=1 Tax=Maribacter sp. 2307ULW6-5 TaxID=3386275 RepID=UPI0039BCF12B
MSLVTFDRSPFGDLFKEDFHQLDHFMDHDWIRNRFPEPFWNSKGRMPALNIKEHKDHFEVELAAPGFDKDNFEVTLDNGCLHITAKKEELASGEEQHYTRREFGYHAFQRSLQLPENVREDAIAARYKDGILSFKLHKKEDARKTPPKKVAIS